MQKSKLGKKKEKIVKKKDEEEEVSEVEDEDDDEVLDLGGESDDNEDEDEDEEDGDDEEMDEEEVEEEEENEDNNEDSEGTEVVEKKQKKKGKLIVNSDESSVDMEAKERKSGVLYISHIPPLFTVSRMRNEMEKLGKVGRIFLQPEKTRGKDGKKRKRYTEGWVEFVSKGQAKRIALSINNTPVTGGRRSVASGTLWNCKYLSGFKWIHLTEQLAYEKKLENIRMRSEINQAKRVAEHFTEQIEKGKHLKRLEEKVMKKNGVWEAFQRQISQRKSINAKKSANKEKKAANAGAIDDSLMKMIFND